MRTAAIILIGTIVVLGVQALAYLVSDGLGELLAWAGIIWVAIAAWLVGKRVDRRHILIACVIGSLLGFAYWMVDWEIIRFVRVDLLRQLTGSQVVWLATGFWFLKWPSILAGGVAGGVSSWRNKVS